MKTVTVSEKLLEILIEEVGRNNLFTPDMVANGAINGVTAESALLYKDLNSSLFRYKTMDARLGSKSPLHTAVNGNYKKELATDILFKVITWK